MTGDRGAPDPRRELFDQIAGVFRQSGRSVPVFNDKHLSFSYGKARQMVAWARKYGIHSAMPMGWGEA